ncbi:MULTISPECIES: autotransporter outer membrane beta-barrel domain-containing protein [unclassified Sphingomonas]|uniref:autotransporter outer membrane beta-barrel domain-containing protein n=1 Tax=unclassified Sphingomonas TaxID=196159 RepID=UPI001F3A9A37|nr:MULTISPECIES: autotransporter outer membrane beta-barrel domain-containing protein [unclassified Sphingomonas]
MLFAMMVAAPAYAECAPDPAVANTDVTCSGTDNNGIRITVPNPRVIVENGAVVRGAGAPAIDLTPPAENYSSASVTVNGSVDGNGSAGIRLLRPTSNGFNNYQSLYLNLNVAAGASVTGNVGVLLTGPAATNNFSYYGDTFATIDNAGTINGTTGIGLVANAPNSGFQSITNRAGGTIGAIVGQVRSLTNNGTIDGGTRGALIPLGSTTTYSSNSIVNSGTITASTTAATIQSDLSSNNFGSLNLTNSGVIANAGTGAALNTKSVYLSNATTGRITTAGSTAIRAADLLSLENRGTITGDVVVAATSNGSNFVNGSTITNRTGTITGNVRFGAGNDTLVVAYENGAVRTGISGAIDGGAGTDQFQVRFADSATLASSLLQSATGFETLGLYLAPATTVTLATGFTSPGTLRIGGDGTVVNNTDLAAAQTVVTNDLGSQSYGGSNFTNAGTIRSTAVTPDAYALAWNNGGRVENSGSIVSTGSGVSVQSGFNSRLVNTGTITTTGTGANLFSAGLTNSGTIRSTAGVGVVFNGSNYSNEPNVNTGRIEGAQAGVVLGGDLRNAGTITSANTGVAINGGAQLVNRAGGTISGGARAIGPASNGQNFYQSINNVTIANAGTITGDVVLSDGSVYSSSNNTYFALRGGVLNGNLVLGNNGRIVTELANGGPGIFAGINGTVDAPGAAITYRVRGDATVSVNPGTFGNVGYDLYDNAALTIASTTGTRPLIFAGNGSVDTSVDVTTSAGPILILTTPTLAVEEAAATQNLRVTSRGVLTLNYGTNSSANAAVVAGSGSTFTNAGTIAVVDRGPSFQRAYAIAGGESIVNTGTISLNGGIGIGNSINVTNTGRIVQTTGGLAATGIVNAVTLTNTGTIDVAGTAVQYDYSYSPATILNSGRIASSTGSAIVQSGYGYYPLVLTNQAGATIAGNGATAIRGTGIIIDNAGTITGDVNLRGDQFSSGYSAYVANGGALNGNLLFGNGPDLFVETDGQTGVTGRIDGGNGSDIYRYRRTTSGTVTLGQRTATSFEREEVEAINVGTVLTIAGTPSTSALWLSGNGAFLNTVDFRDGIYTGSAFSYADLGNLVRFPQIGGFTNQATIGFFNGQTGAFTNTGTIGRAGLSGPAVQVSAKGAIGFDNSGTIRNNGMSNFGWNGTGNFGPADAVSLYSDWSIVARNSGTIQGGGLIASTTGEFTGAPGEGFGVVVINTGTISARRGASDYGAALYMNARDSVTSGKLQLVNGGSIIAEGSVGQAVAASFAPAEFAGVTRTVEIANSGVIRANGGGIEQVFDTGNGAGIYTLPGSAISVDAPWSVRTTIANFGNGVIEATGARSSAIIVYGSYLDLTNAATIRGGAGTVLANDDLLGLTLGTPYLAGAVQGSRGDDRISNTGTIIGSIALGAGNDYIENYGRIDGNVFLGAGDDTFVHAGYATQIGTVDAGEGVDTFVLNASGGGSVNGDQFVNFERFRQIGAGNVTYSGIFRFNTVDVSGGSLTVAAGQTLTSAGATTITGGDGAETIYNYGTIAGSVSLGGGNDYFLNAGLVAGSVLLGSGNDVFVDRPGSRVTGTVDGGDGDDLYNVILAGDRNGLGSIRGFERLFVEGNGTLSLTQTEALDRIALAGTSLNLTQQGNRVGLIGGTDAAERVVIDGDAGVIALGGGDDVVSIGSATAAGFYAGGTGNDLLRFANTGAVTLSGQAIGFETVSFAGGALTVTGSFGEGGASVAFGDGDQSLTIGTGGRAYGSIDLGAGNDSFRLAAGGALFGTVAGGAGSDLATIEVNGTRTLAEGTLTGFETLASAGSGILTLTGTQAYERINAATDLTIASDGRVTAPITFGAGDQRLVVNGLFAGSVDGGAGNDAITVTSGNAASANAFSSISNVEAFAMTGGYATISGTASLGVASLSAGRLVGLAGSTINASRINVGAGATFGSAGTVNGNLTVAGLLSPGASIGTMTVNGNVALLSGSISQFELAQSGGDRLVVNGAVSIEAGSTLQLLTTGTIRPGTSFDLIVANGGITGSYSTIQKPSDLFGYVAQRSDRISLLGQFRTDGSVSPQVARSIDYANRTLVLQPDGSALGLAAPALLNANGGADATRFALVTPEAYASATQIGVDNALTLAQTTRGPAFATGRTDAGAYTFAQVLGQWHTLGADATQGTAKAQTRGNGYLGGIGYGDANASIGVFAGWLDTRQFINTLATQTRADGLVAGATARYQGAGGFGFAGSLVYNDARARTDRLVPGRIGAATSRYDLTSWSADASVFYAAPIGDSWALTPRVGGTFVRTTREGVGETGGSPFALTVARDQHRAGFVDAGLGFGRSELSDAAFRPFVTLGGRYQVQGTRTEALGGYANGGLGLLALGAGRAPMVGTASGGVTYRYTPNFELYGVASAQTGRDDHQESVIAGARLRF